MIEKVKLDQKFNQYKKSRESHIQEYQEGLDQFSTDIIKCIKGQAENVENPVLISEFFKYIDLTTIQNKEIHFHSEIEYQQFKHNVIFLRGKVI